MKILLTGATGFVGLNIADSLLASGHQIVSYQRPGARRQYLDRLHPTVAEGELSDVDRLCTAMQDTDAVIHTAGQTSCDWHDRDQLWQCNVDGTRAVLEAATRSRIQRLVFTSTTSTIGSTGNPAQPADENTPLRGWRARSPYAQSKLAAETILLQQDRVPVVILNVAEVLGPWDHSLQWGRIVLAVAGNQLPFVPPGSATFCSARDVARAHIQALVRGEPGQRYIIGSDSMRIASLISLIAERAGCAAQPATRLPWPLLQWQSQYRQWASKRFAGRVQPPAVDAYRMRVFGGHHLFSDEKARNTLDYHRQPLSAAIDDCMQWYRCHGFLGRPEHAAPHDSISHPTRL